MPPRHPLVTLANLLLANLLLVIACWPVSGADPDRPFGIAQRIPWTGGQITGSPDPPSPYRLQRVLPQLQFKNPTLLTSAPDSDRLFVAELEGKIYSFPTDLEGGQADLFFDMRASIPAMRQIYGLTFHPQFATNGYCYLCYVLEANDPAGTRVSRFHVTASDPPQIDPDTEEVLLTWIAGGHNGGCLKFGPDGYLYITTGDGGPAFPPDPKRSGQDVGTLLSSVLRIDIDDRQPRKKYAIPADNPFVELPGARGEIWCYGLRNPWKMSFDSLTGDLWVGDVGWELWEMVYRVERGGNYGWSLVEGPQPVHRERQRGPTPILPPTVAHSHIEARSITGGLVYRGTRLDDLVGSYVYGDYVTGKIWGAAYDGQRVTALTELVDTALQIICFGADRQNELYVVGYDGTLHRLVANAQSQVNEDFPRRLSATGLFASTPDHKVAPGVIPYSVNAEPWTDHASAERYVALPGNSQLERYDKSNVQAGYIQGHWKFPNDAVLLKTISLELERGNPDSRRRLETQILHRHQDSWQAYSYVWNDEQNDAILAEDVGRDQTFGVKDPAAPGGTTQQSYHFASRSECLLCHTTRGGSIYGFQVDQLNRDHDYQGTLDNQLRALTHIGVFRQPPAADAATMPSPHDPRASLTERARAYLHVNCAHCHRRGGGGTAALDVRYSLSLEETNLLDARPTQGAFGILAASVIAPGDPVRSVLYYRLAKTGRGRMPYFGSHVVDRRGLKLIHDWIQQLQTPSAAPLPSVQRQRAAERALLDGLRNQKPEDERFEKQVQELLSQTTGALLLVRAIDDGAFASEIRQRVIDLAAAVEILEVRDLFERFMPAEKRLKRLGTVVDAEDLLRRVGDPARGRQLFTSARSVQCKSCHRVGNIGQAVGPDLAQIGKKYDRARLLESILEPSKTIDPKFVTYLVETKEGQIHTGLLVEKNEKETVLKDAQGKQIRISAGNVEFTAPQQKSLMPELLLRDMTAEQVADLLSFLESLKEAPAR